MGSKESLFAGIQPGERGTRAIERLKEALGVAELPPGITMLAGSDNGAYDVYMNLNRHLADGKLERKTKLLVAVGVAAAVGSATAVDYFARAAVAAGRTAVEALEAVAAASTCSVFNAYYRFRDHIAPEDLPGHEPFRAAFNANTFVKPALSVAELEAICIAVSSANACRKCVQGHIEKAKSAGVTTEQIDEIIKAGAAAFATANAAAALAVSPDEPVATA